MRKLLLLLLLAFCLSGFREAPLAPMENAADWNNGTFSATVEEGENEKTITVNFYAPELFPREAFEALEAGDVLVVGGEEITIRDIADCVITGQDGTQYAFSNAKSYFYSGDDYYLVHGTGKLARPELYYVTSQEMPVDKSVNYHTTMNDVYVNVDAGYFVEFSQGDPYLITVVVEDGVVTAGDQWNWNERTAFPHTKTLGEFLDVPVERTAPVDGLYNASLRWKEGNIVTVDVYDYVCYSKEDVENLQAGDIILLEGVPMVIQLVGSSVQNFEQGGRPGYVDYTFGPETPLGSRFLYLEYFQEQEGDYIIYQEYTGEYCVHTATFDVPVENVYFSESDEEGQFMRAEEFLEILKTREEEFQSGKNIVDVLDGTISTVALWKDPYAGYTTEKNIIQSNVENAVNPYILLTTEDIFDLKKLPGFNGNFIGKILQWEDGNIQLDIYGTEFYTKEDLLSLKPGDGLVVDGQRVQVNRMRDDGYQIYVTDNTGAQHVFRNHYLFQPDYCRMVGDEPAIVRYQTMDLIQDQNLMTVVSENYETMESVSVEEFRQLLATQNYLPSQLSVMISEGTVQFMTLSTQE